MCSPQQMMETDPDREGLTSILPSQCLPESQSLVYQVSDREFHILRKT